MMVSMERHMTEGKEPLTKKERLNRNILIACVTIGGVVGGAWGAVTALTSEADPLDSMYAIPFGEGPVPAWFAIVFTLFWGVITPILAWFWHKRAIDEQEAAAYRDGAYYAAYAFLIAAPLWWILGRAGLLPAVNGIIIYIAFTLIWTAVWFWKKYR
jgi:hypothetical protein